jgi:hypothetical protein
MKMERRFTLRRHALSSDFTLVQGNATLDA